MKKLLKTKTLWVAIAGIAGGVALIVNGETEKGIAAILVAIQSINIHDAIAKSAVQK
jgi:hypothetical protein